MKAIVVTPGQKQSVRMQTVPDPPLPDDQVAVKVLRVGLCGTDAEIADGLYGQAPDGDPYLILGHENLGIVEKVGSKVSGLAPGTVVVATVRRPCGRCYNCAHGENDMCTSGLYEERGIKRRHGYMAEFYVESPGFLHVVPAGLTDVAVLLEPLSIVEKGIDHSYLLQRRFSWQPKTAVVFGAGPVGLLATAVLRTRGLTTYVVSREPESDERVQVAKAMGAGYVSVADRTFADVQKMLDPIDLAIEATGVSSVAFGAMQMLGPDAVLCLLSVTGGIHEAEEPIDRINQLLVLGNRVVFGSVNANPRHFDMGIADLVSIERQWPGVLGRLITTRLPWTEYGRWFGAARSGIKTTLEIATARQA
ncbi:MAG TPA: glucose 1-dehydrogenase [Vicinamibacterales bacterium]|nr:glucose 1-dehydrogenase [Vicinamibacterales bacterium]